MATKTPLQEYFNSINTPVTSQQNASTVVDYLSTPQITPQSSPSTSLLQYQSNSLEDRSPGYQVFTGAYTLDDLEKDPEFQLRASRFMDSIGDDEDIFEYLRDTDFSLSSAFVRSGEIKGWSEEAKADYNYLRQKFDNADIGSTKQYMQLAKDLTVDLVADPLNWLAAAFFVPSGGMSAATGLAAKEVAKQGLKKIVKETAKGAKRPALFGAAEGAAWAGPHDFFLQKADVELGLRDQVNWGQTALTTGLGAGIGGIFGGAVGTLTTGTPLLYHKYLSKYSDDVTITEQGKVKKEDVFEEYAEEQEMKLADDTTQAKQTTKESKKDKQVKEEKEDKRVKKITRTKEIISNTFGKPVTQLADIAQNSERLQRVLGHFRSDWAKTLVRGVDKAMLATYGEEVSKRTYGYMTELRSVVGTLNRTNIDYSSWKSFKGTFANTLDKRQNDDLVFLLRLNRNEFNQIAQLRKTFKFDSEVPLTEERARSASLLDEDIDVNVEILEATKNDFGRQIDDDVIKVAAQVRDILDRIFYEASGKTEVFDGITLQRLNLMQSSQMVSNFFPRNFAYSKIKENPEGLIEIIKNSRHSDPQLDPKDTAKQKVIDPITGEILKDAEGREQLVFAATEKSIDENVFGRGNYQKIKDLKEAGKLEEAKQFKAELIVQDMLDRRYSPFEFGTESSGGGGASFLQHRVFQDIDDNLLAPYLENSVEDVLESYIQNASRAITRTAYFGRNEQDFVKKFISGPGNISEELRAAGVDEDEILKVNNKLIKMYNRVTGLDAAKLQLSGGARYFTDALKLTQQMAHLPLATISSLTEPMILLSRIDDTEGKLSAGGQVGKAIVKGIKKDVDKFRTFYKRATGKEVKGFADMDDEYWTEAYKVGLALEQGVMAHIEGLYGEAPKNTKLQFLQNLFFKGNFLTTWTGSVQIAAFTTGKRLIRENAEKLYQHGENITKLNSGRKEYLERQLNDLGIDEKDAVRWYKDSLNSKGVFDEARSRGASKFEELKSGQDTMRNKQYAFYQNRLTNGANRFTKEIILNPSTAEANRPLWFSHPAGQLLAQFAGYPTVFNNTVLKRWAYETAEDVELVRRGYVPQATPKIAGTALAMTSAAVLTNAIRSGGASLEQDDETIILEAVQRWGGLGPADFVYRTQQNAFYGSGPAGTAFKALPGPIVGDIVDAIAYRKGLPEILLTNTPGFSALSPEMRKEYKANARALQKALTSGMFAEEKKSEYIAPYAKGGVVNVPNASEEPDEKKVRGMPFTYAELGGVLAKDVEDRRGFRTGGQVDKIAFQSTEDEVIKHLTKEIRKAAPIFHSNATTSLYKSGEANKFANIEGEKVRYVKSDKLHDLEEEIKYSSAIGMQVSSTPKKSGGKKVKHKGRLRLINPLVLNELTASKLTGSTFVESLQNNQNLQNKIINDSPLPKTDATQLVKKLISDYTDTQNLLKNYSDQPLDVVQNLLNIKESTKVRETLTDLGYDSIQSNDDYILFHNNQFRVTKKLKLRDNFYQGGRVGYADGEDVDKEDEENSIVKQIQEKLAASKTIYKSQENKVNKEKTSRDVETKKSRKITNEDKQPIETQEPVISQENLDNYRDLTIKQRLKLKNPNWLEQVKHVENMIWFAESRQGKSKDTKKLGSWQLGETARLDAVKSLQKYHFEGNQPVDGKSRTGIKLTQEQLDYLRNTDSKDLTEIESRLLVNALLHSREMKAPNWTVDNPQTLKGAGDKILKPLYEGNATNTFDLFKDAYVKIYIYSSEQAYAKESGTGVSLNKNLEKTKKEYQKGYQETEPMKLSEPTESKDSGFFGQRIRDLIPAEAEVYLKKVLFGDREPITEKVFDENEMKEIGEGLKYSLAISLNPDIYTEDSARKRFFNEDGELRQNSNISFGYDASPTKMGGSTPYINYIDNIPQSLQYVVGAANFNLKKGDYNTSNLTITSDKYDFAPEFAGPVTKPGLNLDNVREYYNFLKRGDFFTAAERFGMERMPDDATVKMWEDEYGVKRDADFAPVNISIPVSKIFTKQEWNDIQNNNGQGLYDFYRASSSDRTPTPNIYDADEIIVTGPDKNR